MRRPIGHAAALGALLLAVTLGSLPVSGQEATSRACPATTPEENAALISDLYAAVAAGTDISPFLAEEHTVHIPSGRVEVSQVPGWANENQEDFANLSITVDQVIAEGDLVAAYVTWSGTHQDDNEMYGYSATGKDATWVGSTFFRLECGKIIEVWPVVDSLGRLRDLGVITDDELRTVEETATPTP
jgi:predicted ester cyclase